jgi:hypothetical protein
MLRITMHLHSIIHFLLILLNMIFSRELLDQLSITVLMVTTALFLHMVKRAVERPIPWLVPLSVYVRYIYMYIYIHDIYTYMIYIHIHVYEREVSIHTHTFPHI